MLPVFASVIWTLSYYLLITLRSLLFVSLVLGNIIVIWPIYKIIHPLVGYKYEQDLIEDIHISSITQKEKVWS